MLPYIYIGPLKISLYYTAMVLGYAAMLVLMLLRRRRELYRLNPIKSVLFATFVLILGVLGCKILFILENIPYIRKNGLSFGGFSLFGAVLLVPLLMPLLGKLLRLDVRASLDSAAICCVAMLGTIRVGCFLNGCCGGKIFMFEHFDFSFPTQLMESACDFLILFFLLKKEKDGAASGLLYPLFLLLYGSVRFSIEFLRSTEKDWAGLSHAQWFSIASILIGAVFVIRKVQEKELPQKNA